MNIQLQPKPRGVALIIVMLTVFAMAVIVGAFVYAMKVESTLAYRTESEGELQWVGRSGVEYAKWILALQKQVTGEEAFDGLNQFWAGGPGSTNALVNPLEGVSMKDVPLGEAKFSIEIEDADRYLNINRVIQGDPRSLDFLLTFCGASSGEAADIAAALKDWVDRDSFQTPGGAESNDYYLTLVPPYIAKDGPIDSLDELLKVKGVTPQIFWGPKAGAIAVKDRKMTLGLGSYSMSSLAGTVGLADVVRAISSGQVNVNTAPYPVLVAALNGEEGMARNIMDMRAGPDGVDGTLDDAPARNPGEIGRLMGGPAAGGGAGGAQPQFTTISTYFEVHVDAQLGQSKRRYVALVQRLSTRDIRTLTFRGE
ncbi:MAG TPA: hypothetical protein VMF06_10855 [Candidatus Limnocylindria bacterium]|jgi:general secretion pathway protein K|nr:hypothetical protein [Candidatus Limnocylindria bacterium]